MIKSTTFIRVLIAAVASLIAPCAPPQPEVITMYTDVDVKGQLQSNWCYAAAAEMVRDFIVRDSREPDDDQCRAASKEWYDNVTACCQTGASENYNCLNPGSAGNVLRALWGISAKPNDVEQRDVLTFEELKSQLTAPSEGTKGSPVVATWFMEDGTSCPSVKHNVVVIGTVEVGEGATQERFIVLNDPLPEGIGERWIYTAEAFESDESHRRQLPPECNQPTSDDYDIGR